MHECEVIRCKMATGHNDGLLEESQSRRWSRMFVRCLEEGRRSIYIDRPVVCA